MAIDFYEGSNLLLSVKEKMFTHLQETLTELRQRTGRTVDPYGTTHLPPEHARIWVSSLRDALPKIADASTRAVCEELIRLLASAQQRGTTLLVEGE